MVVYGLKENGERRRRLVTLQDGFSAYKSEWMEYGEASGLSPTVFLVEQSAGSVLKTHFHRQNEYQIVVAGGGQLGPREATPFTLHYAGAYTGYGPITAGLDGLSYFTIRATFDSGALYVPEALGELKRGPKIQAHPDRISALDDATRSAIKDTITRRIIEKVNDNVLSDHVILAPGSSFNLRPVPQTAGMFVVLLGGAVAVPENGFDDSNTTTRRLKSLESIFISSDEVLPLSVRAESLGCEFCVLHIPPIDPVYAT